ncbi:hypothetical protein BCV44_13435 [Vibrio cyclitrophicus]|uniref:Ig-like domain-containing protein n=2 Tax=Vibrio cyclitrophicus TaxID=47951 RepID=A0A7Z1S4J1_9VIBR|nr:hypothetical protein [Vibrio cyclitrophicus]CAH6841838.1 hypothetical protein VCHA36P164_10170 [Vibrio chagasii]PME16800.1 hypothetical protein BCV44_13435 [Vibrio cyclitrophicus]PMP14470.1 hypothetical protein BCS91_11445 [Vibrio cyclitrophicus]PMP32996.1 hypothetical protein BCS90_09685 [Vibrio cyclitrophicus]CAH7172457.1 hypothetical protein VCHA40P242_20571 [Vibrio chagasii]
MAINLEGTALRVLTLEATNFETVTLDGVVFARKPTITTQPVGGTINDNQSHAMSVVADGLGTALTYQWFMDGGAISGATGASHTFTPAGDTTNRTFFCQVAGFGGGNTQTSTVTVTVNPSWVATTTFTKGHNPMAPGFLEVWGYDTFFEPAIGNINPNPPTGQTMNYLALASSLVGEDNQEMVTIGNISPPSGSRVVIELSATESYTCPHQSDWTYTIPAALRSWIRNQQASAIRLSYFASLAAQEENDPFLEHETADEYHMRLGVHESQRPELYTHFTEQEKRHD